MIGLKKAGKILRKKVCINPEKKYTLVNPLVVWKMYPPWDIDGDKEKMRMPQNSIPIQFSRTL